MTASLPLWLNHLSHSMCPDWLDDSVWGSIPVSLYKLWYVRARVRVSRRGEAALRAKARGLPRAKAKPRATRPLPRPCEPAAKKPRAAKPRHVAAKPRNLVLI